MAGPRIGVALGSGGARGWCHIGVLRALAEMDIRPDVIAGCSMGAVVGAAHAAGRMDALEEWTRAMTRAALVRLMDVRLSSGGLVEGGQIREVLQELGLPERIEDLECPFIAVATDMETGREVWLKEGDLCDAVRASAALPGVISPFLVGEHWLMDGGLTNPVPVSACRAMGADLVIAVNPNAKRFGRLWQAEAPSPPAWMGLADALPEGMRRQLISLMPEPDEGPRPPSYLEVVSVAIDVMTEQIRRTRLAAETPDVVLNARLNDVSVMDLHRAEEAIEEGRRMVARQADDLREAVDAAT
ncbi:MAG: patatin-like phospholipase family protein [Rhodobacteraceae bacterium]|nr:patatin-like phospholipase family protein [Paracoccaceae bacterium]